MQRIKAFKLLESKPATVYATPKESKSKIYNRKWQRIRRLYLDSNPLCVHCLQRGDTTPATQVDHILRLKWGGTHHPSNLQALCASCHARKTQLEQPPTTTQAR
jgi:5-methylcytosine-specific restriction protein A